MKQMIKAERVSDVDGVVLSLERRFLSVSLSESDRRALSDYLAAELGSETIDVNRRDLEVVLRKLLHLMLSAPEYQLG